MLLSLAGGGGGGWSVDVAVVSLLVDDIVFVVRKKMCTEGRVGVCCRSPWRSPPLFPGSLVVTYGTEKIVLRHLY
jgi:hypothetical protein